MQATVRNITFLFSLSVSGWVVASQACAAESTWDKDIRQGKPHTIAVYHSPSCGCCSGWITHLKKHGFEVNSIETDDVQPVKRQHGVPMPATSCHTALIEGYVIEGHVPANDIKQLIESGKHDILGLSVPQMPVGTPGMEMGERKDAFDVISFDKAGDTSIYHHYEHY